MLTRLFSALLVYHLIFLGHGHATNDREFFEVRRDLRRTTVHTVKSAVAQFDEQVPVQFQGQNEDLDRFADFRGTFGKGLNHFDSGFIDPAAENSLLFALQTGFSADFNNIRLGFGLVRLVNPQASLAYALASNDGWINTMPAAPAFSSAETADEMVELYWTVLVRDVPFNAFDSNVTVAQAVADLNTLTDFQGPKINGQVTPQTFLRGNAPGELIGPYVSQFLLQTIPYGSTEIGPEQNVPLPGDLLNNFMFDFNEWFTVENGGVSGQTIQFDPVKHFLRNPRDLGEYVHVDTPIQEAFNAARLLLSYGPDAIDPASPYLNNPTQDGFVTFGEAGIINLATAVTEEGLKGAWYQKWQVQMRQRPEEFGFYVHETLMNGANLQINPQLLNSPVMTEIFNVFGDYFLPQAYPEGSPTHPSYPAGHATFIGAAVTVLKALFRQDFVIPNPLQPDPTNTALVPYAGTPLTVEAELNKLASNVSLGRDHAGVHYRSDGWQGMLLGEKIAIDLLNNDSFLFNEEFSGYTLTTFEGQTITVGGKREVA